MIWVIVDYGAGNLFRLSSSVRSLGAEWVTHEAADLHTASHILLPGVVPGDASGC